MEQARTTILIVDDEPDLRTMVAAALRNPAWDVIQVGSASDALEICSDLSRMVSLVISDFHMPSMSGFQLASEMRRLRPMLGFIFMSGNRETCEHLEEQGSACVTQDV